MVALEIAHNLRPVHLEQLREAGEREKVGGGGGEMEGGREERKQICLLHVKNTHRMIVVKYLLHINLN